MKIEHKNADVALTLQADQGVFRGEFDNGKVATSTNVDLVATFDNNWSAVIPLRIRPRLPVSTIVYRVNVLSCTDRNLRSIQSEVGEHFKAVEAFLTAEAALKLTGPDGCGAEMKRRITRAWFDRSYELVTRKSFYRLSKRAADAYRVYEPRYVKQYEEEDVGEGFKLVNNWKLEELSLGTEEGKRLAIAINSHLLARLRGDPELATMLRIKQGLTRERLISDTDSLPIPSAKPTS